MRSRFTPLLFLSAGLVATTTLLASSQEKPTGQGFSFKTGVDLINVAATVTDDTGRFVPSLRREDFVLYEDGKQQEISQFEAERVGYAIGIDASGGDSRYASSSPSGPSQPTSFPQPSPFPGRPSRLPPPIVSRPSYPPPSRMPGAGGSSDRVNVDALRSITD